MTHKKLPEKLFELRIMVVEQIYILTLIEKF